MSSSKETNSPQDRPTFPAAGAVVLAWLVPGLGHLVLRRTGRAVIFAVLVLGSAALGCYLQGKLFVPIPGQPLSTLGTIGSMAMGIPYFLLRFVLDYQSDIRAASYEYGGAFLLTAGLMNFLVVLDAWDVATGAKR